MDKIAMGAASFLAALPVLEEEINGLSSAIPFALRQRLALSHGRADPVARRR